MNQGPKGLWIHLHCFMENGQGQGPHLTVLSFPDHLFSVTPPAGFLTSLYIVSVVFVRFPLEGLPSDCLGHSVSPEHRVWRRGYPVTICMLS